MSLLKFVSFLYIITAVGMLGEESCSCRLSRSPSTDFRLCSNRSYLKLSKLTMRSTASGNLVEAKFKKRQRNGRETSPTAPLAHRPDAIRPASSHKPSATQRRGSEVEYSDQVSNLKIAPTADPLAILEGQRRDIDRIMSSVDLLQEEMISLRGYAAFSEESRSLACRDLAGDVDLLTKNITPASNRLSELDGLKFEMKMMQQRIKRFEDSISRGRRSSTVSDSIPVSRRPSPAIDEEVTPPNDVPSRRLIIQTAQTPTSAPLEGFLAPSTTVFEKDDLMEEVGPSLQSLLSRPKAEALLPETPSTKRLRTPINSVAHGRIPPTVNMPPPQIPHMGLEQIARNKSSDASKEAAPGTSMAGTKNPSTPSQAVSRMREVSPGSHHNHQEDHTQEDHTYDDELLGDVHPPSSTDSSARTYQHSASKTTRALQTQINESAKQTPSKPQRQPNPPTPLPNPNPSTEKKRARGRPARHDTKRRKTTTDLANTPNATLWALDPPDQTSASGHRDEQGRFARVDCEGDGEPAGLEKGGTRGRKRSGGGGSDGDGARVLRSVKRVKGKMADGG